MALLIGATYQYVIFILFILYNIHTSSVWYITVGLKWETVSDGKITVNTEKKQKL
jgi:hypothetical protein